MRCEEIILKTPLGEGERIVVEEDRCLARATLLNGAPLDLYVEVSTPCHRFQEEIGLGSFADGKSIAITVVPETGEVVVRGAGIDEVVARELILNVYKKLALLCKRRNGQEDCSEGCREGG